MRGVSTAEYAARQMSADGFTGLTRCHPPSFPDGVDAVVGTRSGRSEVQQVRFSASKWAPDRARGWLRSRGFFVGTMHAIPGDPLVSTKADNADVESKFVVTKLVPDKQYVFGWLYVCRRKDGSDVVDHSGEVVSLDVLEAASYKFVSDQSPGARTMDTMHDFEGAGRLIECMVFTPEKKAAMGIPDGVLPDAMWVGFHVEKAETWLRIKGGELRMFSLAGTALLRALKALSAAKRAADRVAA